MRKIQQLRSASETAFKPSTQADDKEEDTSSRSESSNSTASGHSASSASNSTNSIKFKATLGDTTKLFSVKVPVSLKKLRRAIATAMPDTGRVRISWIDEDGDKISIGT